MFKALVADILGNEVNLDKNAILSLIELPPDSKLGDYAFPCFSLAKKLKKSPADVAKELSEKINADFIEKINAVGPYLNFFIKPEFRAKTVVDSVSSGKFWNSSKANKKILVEYPSPNTNKPLHLGHVRNMTLGSAISTILSKDGNNLVQVNLNNDRGVHICKSMLAYKKWGEDKQPDKKSDHFVGDFYVKFQQEAKKNPELEKESQEMLKSWENNDKEVRKLWELMNFWAFNGFKETYKRYRISFDKEYNESEHYKEGKQVVLDNIDKFEKEDGAVVIKFNSKQLPDKVLLRSDGTSVYMTQDLALTMTKIKDFNPDLQIWVVGNEQNLHFQQLFAILEKLGVKGNFHHLSYGMVSLPEGKMKSREGTVVDADDMLDEMENLAANEIKKRREDWDDNRIKEVSKEVALGAIRFFMLKFDPAREFTFDPKTSLSFEGDTGPYLQYTHARVCSILRKEKQSNGDLDLLSTKEEQDLLRQLERFPYSFRKAADEYKPNSIANHLLEIAQSFNTFYHKCPVLKAENNVKNARLVLLETVKKVLAEGLLVLGITPLEEM